MSFWLYIIWLPFFNLQGDTDEDVPSGGFHMGLLEKGRSTSGPGFSLKFWPDVLVQI